MCSEVGPYISDRSVFNVVFVYINGASFKLKIATGSSCIHVIHV